MAEPNRHTVTRRSTQRPFPSSWKALGLLLGLLWVCPWLACGTDSTGTGTGTVGLLVADAPSDDFEAVNMTITKLELMGHRAETAIVFEGRETFDLLALRDASELFSITGEVRSGRYHKIRITLAEEGIELVDRDGQRNYPELPRENRLEFSPETSIEVNAGNMVIVEVDIDVDRSIHEDSLRSRVYRFRPVLQTRIVRNILDGRLARLRGIITSIDAETQTFRLCHMRRPQAFLSMEEGHGRHPDRPAVDAPLPEREERHHPRNRCIGVSLAESASIFDENGDPVDGIGEDANGTHAMVAGRLRPHDQRIEMTSFLMLMGPPGTFKHHRGIASSDYDEETQQFDLDIRGDRPDLIVQLQDSTKLFEHGGMEVGPEAIASGVRTGVVGLFVGEDEESTLFKAVVVSLNLDAPEIAPLEGEIVAIHLPPDPELDECHLELVLDEGGLQGVGVGRDTRILTIDPEGRVSSVIRLEDLREGDQVNVYGPPPHDEAVCQRAGIIIAFPEDVELPPEVDESSA